MTDQMPEPAPAGEPAAADHATVEATTGPDPAGDGQQDSGSREAAKYRTRLRAAEAERDTLAAERQTLTDRLLAGDRAQVQRIAAAELRDPADFLLVHADLDAFRGPDGEIDADLVAAAAVDLATQRPHWKRESTSAAPASRPIEHLRGGASPYEMQPGQASWADVLRGGR